MTNFVGTELTFGETLAKSGVGILIVFVGLIVLVALVSLMGRICQRVLTEQPNAPAQKAVAPKAVPAQKKAEIENRDELIVAFSAAVAEELGTDVSAIRVVSFKEIG